MTELNEYDKAKLEKIRNAHKITITIADDVLLSADFNVKGDHRKYRMYFSNLSFCLDTIKKLIIDGQDIHG